MTRDSSEFISIIRETAERIRAEKADSDARLAEILRDIREKRIGDGPSVYVVWEHRLICAPPELVNDPGLNELAQQYGYRIAQIP